jgi:hypothetical protein
VDFVPVGENKINYVSEQECYFFSNQPHYKITKLASSLKEYFDLEKHIYGVRNQRAFEKEINSIVEICKTTASYHKDAVSSYVENFNQA